MRSTSSLRKSVGEYCGFLLFATFIGSAVWLVHVSANGTRASGSEGQTSNVGQSQRQQNSCKQCAPPGNQIIYAPLIELPETSGTEINLNCRSPHVMDVTPTFYTQKGEAIVGDVFQMQPAEVKTVNLKTLMPLSIRNRQDWGGMTLSFTGGMLEMWAQLRLMNVNHGNSVDIVFSILQDKRSDVRNAVWWMPEHGEAIIALGNFANSAARATVKFSNGDSEDVEVPAFGTHLIRKRSEQFRLQSNGEGEAVSVSAPHSNGSIIVAGAVTAIDGSFTSSIRFYDTQNVAQPNLYATNFPLKNVKPRMILRNTGTETISATPRFIPVFGDPDGFMDLPSVTLQPNEIADVDIEPLRGAVYGRSDFDDVSIQVLNTGSSGSLIGSLNGQDSSTGMIYDVPLRDIGGLRNSTGAYPWRLDHDLSTVVSITNIASMRSEIVVQINYPGGPYLLNPRRLSAGETVTYDLRKIRDDQIPDSSGHTIPLSVTGGQFKWFIHGASPGRLIGRAEMLSVSQGLSSSYSCPGSSCPPQYSWAELSPSDVYLDPGDTATVHVLELDCDEFFNCIGPFYAAPSSWQVTDPYGAVLYYDNGESLDLVGFNGGTADITANFGYEQYYWDEFTESCTDEGWDDSGSVSGQARVVHINSISPARGPVGTTVAVTIYGGWFDNNATPTVQVSGYGVTASEINVISGAISANFNMTADATAGYHTVTVVSHGITSNGVNFFVQAPTTFAPISLSPANLGCASTAGGYGGQVLYGVLDQDGQPMLAAGYTPQEHFTQNGVPAFSGFKFFADSPTTDSSGRFLDKPVGTCFDPTPSSNLCVDVVQTFNIVVGTVTYTIPTVTTRRDCVQGIRVIVTNGSVSLNSSLGTVN